MNINRHFGTESSRAGIDKVSFWVEDFEVSRAKTLSSDAWKLRADKNKENGEGSNKLLYVSREGEPVYGEREYYNGNGVSATIKNGGVQIVFNPNKHLHPYKALAMGKDLPGLIGELERDFATNGLLFTGERAKVNRLDVAKDSTLRYPMQTYRALFLSEPKRMKRREYGEGSFQVGNKSRQLCFYNKSVEAKLKGVEDVPGGISRLEVRGMKARVQKKYGLNTIKDLYGLDEGYANEFYRNEAKSMIRTKYDNGELITNAGGIVRMTELLKETGMIKGKGTRDYLLCLSLMQVLSNGGTLEEFRDALNHLVSDRYARELVNSLAPKLGLMEAEVLQKMKVPVSDLASEFADAYGI